MINVLNLVIFILACAVIFVSSFFMLKSLRVIAHFLKISEFVAGFIILGIGTSIPELFVGIMSAIKKAPALSLGNIIGANILDLTLVIAIPVLIARSIKIKSKTVEKDSFLMVGMCILPVILHLIGNQISRIDGVILIAAFTAYMWRIIKQHSEFTKRFKDDINRWEVAFSFVLFFVCLFLLFRSADYAIEYAKLVAIDFIVPPIFIGIFVLSFGTTLPELITGTVAVIRGEKQVAVGNIIGTVVVNSTLIIGVVSLIHPIESNFVYFLTSAIFMTVFAFIFAVFVNSKKELDWREGIAMVLMYILFLFVELTL